MLSLISTPPRSLAPAESISIAPSWPNLTHEACTLGITRPTVSRITACIRRDSRHVGPGLASPLRKIGAPSATNGSGTTSLNPPVRSCKSMTCCQWRTQAAGVSTWPNIIVAVLNNPCSWAAAIISNHRSVETLSGQRTRRTSASSTSAAVPGSESRPVAFNNPRYSSTGIFSVCAP